MCKPKVDNTMQRQQLAEAAEARAREEARQARIKTGSANVDSAFSTFDDGYWNNRKTSFMDYYQPQLDDQFKQAQEQLNFALARAGTVNSTIAGDKMGLLQTKYDTQRAAIQSNAEADVHSAQDRIQNEKSALLSQLNATGDADRVSNESLARTQQLFNEQPSYDALPDIFSGFANAIGNYNAASQNNTAYQSYFGTKPAKTSNSVYQVS